MLYTLITDEPGKFNVQRAYSLEEAGKLLAGLYAERLHVRMKVSNGKGRQERELTADEQAAVVEIATECIV